jgi:hypothetical protein
MFKSKVRPIVISQYEHGRLAGTLAAIWGNNDFDRPVIDFLAFVRGVTLHDWHYGVIDNLPIGEGSEDDWLATVRKGVAYWIDDPITDIVVKLHIKRLLNGRNTRDTEILMNHIELRITERVPQTPFSRQQFEWADKITRFCDQLAFDFSFETPMEATYSVYTKVNTNQETSVSYKIKPGGQIEVTPWPFSVNTFSGIMIGYQQADYPETLTPEVVHFHVHNGSPNVPELQ